MDSLPAVQKGEAEPRVTANGNASATGADAQAPVPGSFSEEWAARHNHELWGARPDGTYHWRDQADGFYEESEVNQHL
jgi:hypothetical protein